MPIKPRILNNDSQKVMVDTFKIIKSYKNLQLPGNDPQGTYIGAAKGVVMLLDTYQFDLQKLSHKEVTGKNGTTKRLRVLDSVDLYKMAQTAFDMTWYDNAITCLRIAWKLKEEESKAGAIHQEDFVQTLRELTAVATRIHNQMVTKRMTRVGEDYKVFPYVIDEKTLKKKKKQPKGKL